MMIAYLIKNPLGVYQFRRFVPAHLFPVIGKKEIRRTLHTRCEILAKKRCATYTVACNDFFDYAQRHLAAMAKRRRLPQFQNPLDLPKTITFGKISFDHSGGFSLENVTFDPNRPVQEEAQALAAATQELSRIAPALSGSVPSLPITPSPAISSQPPVQSPVQPQVAVAAQIAPVHVPAPTPAPTPTTVPTVQTAIVDPQVNDTTQLVFPVNNIFGINNPLFSKVVEAFLVENSNNKWDRQSTKLGYQNTADTLIRILGDKRILSYSRADAMCFRDFLYELPIDWLRLSLYDDLSVSDSIELKKNNNFKTISYKTAKNHVARLQVIWSFLKPNHVPVTAIFDTLHILPGEDKSYEPFESEHLLKIFNYENYLSEQTRNSPSRYFVPLIALLSGARLGEICFLTPEDIYKKDNIWVMDINRNAVNAQKKSTKNLFSIRCIPIHSKLIELGFLDFVASRKKVAKKDRLFSDYTVNKRGQAGNKFGDAFGRYLTRLGYPRERKYVFHSFRHTAIASLLDKSVPLLQVQCFAGHSAKNMATDKYQHKGFPMAVLQGVVEKLDFSKYLKNLFSYSELLQLNPSKLIAHRHKVKPPATPVVASSNSPGSSNISASSNSSDSSDTSESLSIANAQPAKPDTTTRKTVIIRRKDTQTD